MDDIKEDGAARSHSDVVRSKDVKVIYYRDPDTGKRHRRRIHKAINLTAKDQDGDGDNDTTDRFIRKRRKAMQKAIGKQNNKKRYTPEEAISEAGIYKPEKRVMRKPSIGRGPDGRPRWNTERKKTQNIKIGTSTNEEKRPEVLTVKKKVKLKGGTTYESNPEEAKVAPIGENKKTFKEFSESMPHPRISPGRVNEAKNPYAIGMAVAMKSTGDKPPLEKSTIKKAHKIAKSIDESSERKPKSYYLKKSAEHAIAARQAKSAGDAEKAAHHRVSQKRHWDIAARMATMGESVVDTKNIPDNTEFLKKRKERIMKADSARMKDPFNKKYFGTRKK